MPVVSIIVPVYNVEEYIGECIRSLLAQTHRGLEVILVNDGSTDGSGAVCDGYARENPDRVKVINQVNKGVSAARNAGIEGSTGEWLMFVDGDDWIEPDMIEVMLGLAEAKRCDVCVSGYCSEKPGCIIEYSFNKLSGYILTPEDKVDLFMSHLLETKRLCGYNENVPLSSQCFKLYHKDLFKNNNIRFKDGVIFGEDLLFSMYVLRHAERVVLCAGAFYHYRLNPASAVNAYAPKALASAELFYRELGIFTDSIENRQDAEDIFNIQAFFNILFSIKNTYRSKNAPFTFRQKERGIKNLVKKGRYRAVIANVPSRYLGQMKRIQLWIIKYLPVWFYCAVMGAIDRKRERGEKA